MNKNCIIKAIIGGTISLGLATSVCAQVTVTTTAHSTMAPIRTLGPGYVGLEFEKNKMANSTFDPVANANMVALLKLLSPQGVIKLGGSSADSTSWLPNGPAAPPNVNGTPITQAEVNLLSSFLKATGWKCLYTLNLEFGSQSDVVAEAQYVANSLGSSLLGFVLGDEPDTWTTYAQFIAKWKQYAAAIRAVLPNAVFYGPGLCCDLSSWGASFATNAQGIASVFAHHYYRDRGGNSTATMSELLASDPNLDSILGSMNTDTRTMGGTGFALDETNSFSHGGFPGGISDAFGSGLWGLYYLEHVSYYPLAMQMDFTNRSLNETGTPDQAWYAPINCNADGTAQEVRPLYYGMYTFMLASQAANSGQLIHTTNNFSGTVNCSIHSYLRPDGSVAVVIDNKDAAQSVTDTISFGKPVASASSLALTAPSVGSLAPYVRLGGAQIGLDATFNPTWNTLSLSSSSTVTVTVPAGSALVVVGTMGVDSD